MNQLFTLTFKRFLRIVETNIENLVQVEKELKEINLIMTNAISALDQSKGRAEEYFENELK